MSVSSGSWPGSIIFTTDMHTIGILDSGVGGLSVYREIVRLLPDSSYIYYSDSAHCPYGDKAPEFVCARVREITELLLSKGAEIIVVACNTATAAAIRTMRMEFDGVPFVGMEPALKPAALETRSGVIGVLATAGTLKGSLYIDTKEHYAGSVRVIEHVGDGFVQLVEDGRTHGPEVREVVQGSLRPLLDGGADTIVLGCTHYPFLLDTMRDIAGPGVEFIDPAPAVARRVCELLGEKAGGTETSRQPQIELLCSGDGERLKQFFASL